jgi:hypothetical protein
MLVRTMMGVPKKLKTTKTITRLRSTAILVRTMMGVPKKLKSTMVSQRSCQRVNQTRLLIKISLSGTRTSTISKISSFLTNVHPNKLVMNTGPDWKYLTILQQILDNSNLRSSYQKALTLKNKMGSPLLRVLVFLSRRLTK